MYKNKKILGLIPARSGSKGLPGKNIRVLHGKPLIAWTIEQAHLSKYLDNVIVSTEDESIAEIAKKYNAEVPFRRPAELATDETSGLDVVFHAMQEMEDKGRHYDIKRVLRGAVRLELTGQRRDGAKMRRDRFELPEVNTIVPVNDVDER